MSFSPDYTLTYVSGTQTWNFKPGALPLDKQALVQDALKDGRLDAGELATFAQWQTEFPGAFSKRGFMENLPPPEEFALQRFSSSWSGMDINALMAFINEQANKLSADLRQQSNQQQIDQIEHSLELAEQKKTASTNEADDTFAAAVVDAVLSIFAAVVSAAAAAASQVVAAKDLIEAKNLAQNKAQALVDKFKHQNKHDALERSASKLDEKVSLANKAAADAHPIGIQPSRTILQKQQDLMTTDRSHMTRAQKTALDDEIQQVTTALECKLKAEKLESAATKAHAKADAARKRMEDAEMRLSAAEDKIRQLDAHTQHTANFFRLFPTITPMFEQLGHVLSAIYHKNASVWRIQADWLTNLIQNSDNFADLLKNQANSFKDLNDATRKTYEDYVNGQNEANRSIASHV